MDRFVTVSATSGLWAERSSDIDAAIGVSSGRRARRLFLTVTPRTGITPRRPRRLNGAEEGTRTPTPFREAEFKSAASAVPPPRQSRCAGFPILP